MKLSNIWKRFAGPIPTELSFSKNIRDIDAKLLKDLELARSKFSPFPQFNYCFSSPPTAPKRKIQWAESRRCVLEVLDKVAASKQSWISLSHTETESIVIGCRDDKNVVTGVGVDLEKKGRLIEPGAAEKFILPTESRFGLSHLAIWTIKEACYKADNSRLGTVVSHYEIKDFNSSSGEGLIGLQSAGSSFARFKFLIYDDLAISFCIAEKL